MRLTRIVSYDPPDLPDFSATLVAYAACDDCDGTGRVDGYAHRTGRAYELCPNEDCVRGEIHVHLDGDEAVDVYTSREVAK